ncbi:MAG TPA: tetratricopeptide repeat protein [Tepidisphaeraceae bacterium]|jgi:tetratricopeptide (TPR) repeat protein
MMHYLGTAAKWLGAGCLTLTIIGCASRDASTPAVNTYVEGARAYREGDRDHAISALSSAVQQNPDLIMARKMLGDMCRSGGDLENAAQQYEAVVRLDPYGFENFYNLGLTYQMMNRLEQAASNYLKSLKLNAKDADANLNLGLVYLALGQPADAEKYLQQALAIDANLGSAWANLGVALDAQAKYSDAENAYRKALELDPVRPSTLVNFASNLTVQGKSQEAIQTFEQATQREDSALARKRYGDALVLAKRYDDAIAQYEAALKLNKNYFPALNAEGLARIAQYKQGLELDDSKRGEAINLWRKSLEIKKDQPNVQALIRDWEKKALFKD